ncbi:MAG: glutamate--tRNA ligase [Deltaproteobacteria bacterium]|jgi:glutamyl-tRNA synthetase|nr:glutamate--tRNA ligase [Deltaproteobacteria bacterium]
MIITRFAPSPTGHLHIGGARTALFNWLLARGQGGQFVLRVEDTDAQRSKEEHTQAILAAMSWLGLDWDGEPVYQSARFELHRQHIQKLLADGRAYWCHCRPEDIEAKRQEALKAGGKPRYDGHCRELGLGPAPGGVIRFKSPPTQTVSWPDLIKGPISVDSEELDDLVLLKSDGNPTYNLAVVVDDLTMGVTHIIRGDDHVNNTPRQILLYQALGANLPQFGHVPMILGQDKARLSKRHGATSVMAYKEMGYLPQALNNYLARLGWSHGDQEIFSLQEMVELFSLKRVGKSASVFNPEKLNWLNAHYIKQTSTEELGRLVWPYLAAQNLTCPNPGYLAQAMATVRERGKTLVELAEKAAFYFQALPPLNPKDALKLLTSTGLAYLAEVGQELRRAFPQTHEALDELLKNLASAHNVKMGQIAQPLRLALTGQTASPGLFDILNILGPERVNQRVQAALAFKPNQAEADRA